MSVHWTCIMKAIIFHSTLLTHIATFVLSSGEEMDPNHSSSAWSFIKEPLQVLQIISLNHSLLEKSLALSCYLLGCNEKTTASQGIFPPKFLMVTMDLQYLIEKCVSAWFWVSRFMCIVEWGRLCFLGMQPHSRQWRMVCLCQTKQKEKVKSRHEGAGEV